VYPFFYMFISLLCGMAAASGTGIEWRVGAAAAALIVFIRVSRKPAVAAAFLLGVLFAPAFEEFSSHLTGEEEYVEGTADSAEVAGEGYRFILRTEGKDQITVYASEHPGAGDKCLVYGTLIKPQEARSPFQFDYKNYLLRQNIYWQIFADKVECSEDRSLKAEFFDRRFEQLHRIGGMGQGGAIAAALVFGERSFIEEERIDQYQMLGVIHLLAVSGLHVGLITAGVWFLLVRIGMTRETAAVILFLLMPLYIVYAGAAPSVIRAGAMTMLGLLFLFSNKKIPLLEIYSVTGILYVLMQPSIIYHIGFQLSFVTSAGLILSAGILKGNGFSLMMKVTFAAQIISLPLIIYYFYSISLMTFAANALFIPVISFIVLPLSFAGVFMEPGFPWATEWVFSRVETGMYILHQWLDVMEFIPWHLVTTGKPLPVFIILWYVFILIGFVIWEKRKKWAAAALLSSAVLLVLTVLPVLDKNAYIHFLDVGQGDASVIELPGREAVYMIDTGGLVKYTEDGMELSRNGPGKQVVLPFLKGRGIDKIDALIISHGHADHMGEICYLSSRISIGQVIYPVSETVPEIVTEAFACLAEQNVPVYFVSRGDRWETGESRFHILHPTNSQSWSENDRSIVLKAEIEGVSILFTGDIEEPAEKELEKNPELLKTDVLKAAHHGSITSSSETFLNASDPHTAVISAGGDNRFGHPHEEVVERMESKGITVYQTNLQGTVTMKVKEGVLETLPFFHNPEDG